MKIFIGSDHGGFKFKEELKPWLAGLGHEVVDCGNTVLDPIDDFPDFAFRVADKVASDPTSRGIVLCRSAGGVTIASNKVRGIRAVTGVNDTDVIHNRRHNNANVLALAADYIPLAQAKKMIEVFIQTPFAGEERFVRRLGKIEEREKL